MLTFPVRHFHGKAQRHVPVKLPVEDWSGKDKGKIGLLKKSMYGTRDAASNWEGDTGIPKIVATSWGPVQEVCFITGKRKTSGLTHGADFVVTGTKGSLLQLKRQLESVYPIKASIIGSGSEKRIKATRHVDVLVESLWEHSANSSN